MSLFRRLMVVLGAGGAGIYEPEYKKDASIFGTYNLCSSVPNELVTASLASTYLLTVLVADIQAFLYEGAYALYKVVDYGPVVALASVYGLSTEAP